MCITMCKIFIIKGMTKERYQQRIVFHINCKNCLLCFSLIRLQFTQKDSWKVFNGIKLTLFNSMTFSNSVECYFKHFKRLLKVLIGFKSFILELCNPSYHVDIIPALTSKYSWIFRSQSETNLQKQTVSPYSNV